MWQALLLENQLVTSLGWCVASQLTTKSPPRKFRIFKSGEMINAPSVKKSTDILLVGACECQSYSNGTYGTKVKKAIEYNQKGCNIQIIKENDFIFSLLQQEYL